jgi:hypothetical protein
LKDEDVHDISRSHPPESECTPSALKSGAPRSLSERLTIAACHLRTDPLLAEIDRDYPDLVPKDFELESWREFIGKIRNYSADRTRPRDRNGSESSAEEQNGEHGEFTVLAERRERILRLRFSNEMHRTKLERLRESTVTVGECEAAMARIRAAVSGEILKLPAGLSQELAGRNPPFIQQVLNTALRSALDRLARPESYL